MKNLFLISGISAALMLLSCGQSESDKQMAQKLTALTNRVDSLTHHDDSIKQMAAKQHREVPAKVQQQRKIADDFTANPRYMGNFYTEMYGSEHFYSTLKIGRSGMGYVGEWDDASGDNMPVYGLEINASTNEVSFNATSHTDALKVGSYKGKFTFSGEEITINCNNLILKNHTW